MSKRMKIAIVVGGVSNERDISIKSGQHIFDHLSSINYDKCFVEITKEGKWLLSGDKLKIGDGVSKNKTLSILYSQRGINKNDLESFDVIFLALHGKFGEDGKIQSILDIIGIPYTGSGVLASALSMNKAKTMQFLRSMDIKTPKFLQLLNKNDIDLKVVDKFIVENFGYPCIVKPNESGSSIGINIVHSVSDLSPAIKEAYQEDNQILIEEFIKGREFTCGVVGNSNQNKILALPPVEVLTDRKFFDYEAKYISKNTKEICPADIPSKLAEDIQSLSQRVHRAIGCDGLTRSDFILKNNELYFLEINTLPGLTEGSLCPKEVKAVGMTFSEFLDKQIKLAIEKRK